MAWMRSRGYPDAVLTPEGADGGIDIEASEALAQVKAQVVPVGRPVVQQLAGCALVEGKRGYVFGLGGFTQAALAWADKAEIGCLTFDLEGEVEPLNRWAAGGEATPEPLVPWGDDYPAACTVTVDGHGELSVVSAVAPPLLAAVTRHESVDLGVPAFVATLDPPYAVVLTERQVRVYEVPSLSFCWSQDLPAGVEPYGAQILDSAVVQVLGFRRSESVEYGDEEPVWKYWRLSDGIAIAAPRPEGGREVANPPCTVRSVEVRTGSFWDTYSVIQCVDPDGQLRWSFRCADLATGVVRAGDVVLAKVGDALLGLDNRSGTELWARYLWEFAEGDGDDAQAFILSPVSPSVVYCQIHESNDDDDGWVTRGVAIDAVSGRLLWRVPAILGSSALLVEGRLLIPDGRGCWSVDPDDGTGRRVDLDIGEPQQVPWDRVGALHGPQYHVSPDGQLLAVGVDAGRLVASEAR